MRVVGRLDDTLDLAIVQTNGIAGSNLVKHFHGPTGYPRRLLHGPVGIKYRRGAGRAVPREDERIADVQQYRFLDGRQLPESELQPLTGLVTDEAEPQAGGDVCGLVQFQDESLAVLEHDLEPAPPSPRVPEPQHIADLGGLDAGSGDRNHREFLAGPGFVVGDAAHSPWRNDIAQRVPTRSQSQDLGPCPQQAGAEFRSTNIHHHAAAFAEVLSSTLKIVDHLRPFRFRIVRAVDACDIHAGCDQVVHEVIVVRGIRGQRYHDGDGPVAGTVAEYRPRISLEQHGAFAEGPTFQRGIGLHLAGECIERMPHGTDAGCHASFCSAEGRQS